MPVLHALVLGAVQGLTEFVPISSSGHLVLVPAALDWGSPGLAFDVMLHVASLVALLAYFSGDLVDLARGFFAGDSGSRRLVGLLAIGTVPAVLAGALLGDYFEDSFEDARASAVQLVITAGILVAAEQALAFHERRRAQTGGRLRTVDDLRTGDATLVGVAQAVSILPGISRSGSTIAAGLAVATRREDAARFAFLLAIPALFGAALVEVPDLRGASLGAGAATAGFVASLVTSYAAIAILIKYLKTRSLYPFAAYCVVAGAVFYFLV
ncbi:MAG TPA: undecaprenyl-diphosphate phosphatase [Actinomycetota bacterium]|nr:undecaprenyl-diphosphate phosphatase [Actinomycetota bacterium]